MTGQALGHAQQDALDHLEDEGRMTPRMLANDLDVSRQRAHSILTSLVDRDLAQKPAQGLYAPNTER
ncbi:MarR family transcriptional regulator [Natrinema altunense]|uniref:MarR family transcriptional regulator n=1 Tax=Natrinema altunense TaxID=222984 RepID=A0A482Y361_9EURY|nr:MarR family transcriptional regulator [Natrinema altunense]RZH68754.1 MarR family transcriptional regulator [Natrinema altunense]